MISRGAGTRARRKRIALAFVAALALAILAPRAAAQYLGVTLGYDYQSELSGPHQADLNMPLYNPVASDPGATWNEWAAELKQSGVDFVCPNLEGSRPNTQKNPAHIAPFVAALNNQGNVTKLAIFDDNAASWVAQNSLANGHGWETKWRFDIGDREKWRYIYDWNYKLFYQAVPDANRFKIDGRPVIIIWTGNTAFLSNMQGNASRALLYVREKCRADFGFDPYIILSSDFFVNDTTCTAPGVADASHGWFIPPRHASTTTTFKGVRIGALAPSFHPPGDPDSIDPRHGITLDEALSDTVGAGALLTLCEGFTDWLESAALLRVRNLDGDGDPVPYDRTGYDYPNQRINLLRKHGRDPFPTELKFEAEGCDTFEGATGGTGTFRNGGITVEACDDAGGGWNIGHVAGGESFEWKDVPLDGRPMFLARIATPHAGRRGHFVIDGQAQPSRALPATGGWQTYRTVSFGPCGTFDKSRHTVRFVSDNGGINFNWWQLQRPGQERLSDSTSPKPKPGPDASFP